MRLILMILCLIAVTPVLKINASCVPGEIRGLEYLHSKYGVLPWKTVVQPAIRTAREGFGVTDDLLQAIQSVGSAGSERDFLSRDPSWALDFAPNGTRVGLGDKITRKRYADTLELIADQGPSAFYDGPIAEATIRALQADDGIMTLNDLRDYKVSIRNATHVNYRGHQVTSITAPSSGIVALKVLKILETYGDFFAPGNTNLSTHRMDEAIRFGYGEVFSLSALRMDQEMLTVSKRTKLGDPDFVDGLAEYQQSMLKDTAVAEVRKKISDHYSKNVSAYNPQGIESLET